MRTIVYKENLFTRVYRFPGLSRTCINFPGLSSPGKCQNKIPGLSRFSRTRTIPGAFFSILARRYVFTLLSNKGILCFVANCKNIIVFVLLLTDSKELFGFRRRHILNCTADTPEKKINTSFQCLVLLKQKCFKFLNQSLFFV